MDIQLPHASAGLKEALYAPLLDLMEDYQPRTVRQIEQELQRHKIELPFLINAILILTAKGNLGVVQDDTAVTRAKPFTTRLNQHLQQQACYLNKINMLASPLLGGGIPAGRIHQLFLLSNQNGHNQPEEMAAFVWQILSRQGEKIVKNGQTLQTSEDNLTELLERAREFVAKTLPLLKALQCL